MFSARRWGWFIRYSIDSLATELRINVEAASVRSGLILLAFKVLATCKNLMQAQRSLAMVRSGRTLIDKVTKSSL